MSAPTIYRLKIERFRGIRELTWLPGPRLNVVLGGGDVGKTTILDAIGLLLNPSGNPRLSDTDYYLRELDSEFVIEAVFSLPLESGINDQLKPSWPWNWVNNDLAIPSADAEDEGDVLPVYRLRIRGTSELESAYEIVQPDGETATLSVGLRRSIGLVRLSGDDPNDRDLRLVYGSALDRLLSDSGLRSRMARALAESEVTEQLSDEAKIALEELNEAFETSSLPSGLEIALTGGQGFSIAALIGLTAELQDTRLPLASWGAGTRRLASLTIAGQRKVRTPITLIDEVERGLEPYRQRALIEELQISNSQVFLTTHSPTAISAASEAALWYVDHTGTIGPLQSPAVDRQRASDPEAFLSRLTVVAEGGTEQGVVSALLERALGSRLERHGIHVSDGGGHESTLDLLEALSRGGLRFGAFTDDEGKYATRWSRIADRLDDLLFRWAGGCTEDHIIAAVPEERLYDLITDPADEKTGFRLRTLAVRLGLEDKDFETIKAAAGGNLRTLILEAAKGEIPEDKANEKKEYKAHAQDWFKNIAGGRELEAKIFALGLWPTLRAELLPFCNAVRSAVDLRHIDNIKT